MGSITGGRMGGGESAGRDGETNLRLEETMRGLENEEKRMRGLENMRVKREEEWEYRRRRRAITHSKITHNAIKKV